MHMIQSSRYASITSNDQKSEHGEPLARTTQPYRPMTGSKDDRTPRTQVSQSETREDRDKANHTTAMHYAITEQLAIDIIEGRWKPGQSMTLNDIQERFSISRTVAREVAHTLESTHAVIVKKRVGLIAQDLHEWLSLDTQVIRWKLHSNHRRRQLLTLNELRLAVEPIAAADTAIKASIETRALMPVLAMELRKKAKSGNLDEFHRIDVRFHNEILTNSGNELFSTLSSLVSIVLVSRVEQGLYPEKPRPEALDAHEQVADAIWKGDADLAKEAMTRIVDEVRASTEQS